jgi:hypothetical protein
VPELYSAIAHILVMIDKTRHLGNLYGALFCKLHMPSNNHNNDNNTNHNLTKHLNY